MYNFHDQAAADKLSIVSEAPNFNFCLNYFFNHSDTAVNAL